MKYLWLALRVFIHRFYDQFHRIFLGIPTLRRTRITEKIFVGGQYSIQKLPELKERGVTAIVNMRETSVYNESLYLGLKYLHLPTTDQTPPTLEDLQKGVDFISKEIAEGGKVYVHCRQGQGRGPTMAIAYLISTGMAFEKAFEAVKAIRIFINPTPSQRETLKEYEKSLLQKTV
ncbi:MAG: dual specificity protein phosphatase family protein [Verrucomicrobia bacterium]|nr:dual specificity protein phosphatase family protein [Cytophagales bacterium]